MSLVKIESFDLTGTAVADLQARGYNASAGFTITTTGGKFGGGGINCTSTTAGLAFTPPSFQSYATVSVWMKTPSTLVGLHLIACTDQLGDTFASSSDFNWAVGYNSNGSWRLSGDGASVKGTGATGVIATDTWYHLEVRVNITTAGNATLFIDGEEVLDAAGDYIESSATPTFFLLGSTGGITYDDLVIQMDGSELPPLLGIHKIHTLLPSADTAQADWTGASTDIDDPAGATHDGDSTFISSSTLNEKSEFAVANLSESPATVHAVQTTLVSSKTDAGSKAVTPYIVSNATRDDGGEFNPADGAYLYSTDIFPLDPDGSVAWDEASVNAILVGVEVTT